MDDGISGAEFANRPGFLRLMNSLKPRPGFQVLVMAEVSRLGREQIETAYALKQLSTAGVRCFGYLDDRELLMESATDKFLLSAVNFAAELEREKGRQRTTDAMVRKARAGHVTGGRVFAYDNVDVAGPDGRRSHVERRVNQGEAAVVRRIFEMCAAGAGLTAITKALNAERALAPRRNGAARPHGHRALCERCCCARSTAARSSGTSRASAIAGGSRGRPPDLRRPGSECRPHRSRSSRMRCG